MSEFASKKILITGGTKGLGLAIANLFAEEGAELFLSYRSDTEGAEKLAARFKERNVKCTTIGVDLAQADGMPKLFEEIKKHTDSLDVYVHNAAATAFKNLLDIEAHHVDMTFNISVKGFILGVKEATKMMEPGSAIVGISGMDTLKVVPRHGLLGAAKSALEQLCIYFAHELAPKGIRVNGVNPGFFETESTERYLGEAFEKVSSAYANAIPLKEKGKAETIAPVVRFLCSKDAHWLVGQVICADGGFDRSLTLVP